jgi:hypothetical protein
MVGHTLLNLAVGDSLVLASDSEESQTLRLVGTLVGALAMVLSIWYGGVVTQHIMEACYSKDKINHKLTLLEHSASSFDHPSDSSSASPQEEHHGSAVGLGSMEGARCGEAGARDGMRPPLTSPTPVSKTQSFLYRSVGMRFLHSARLPLFRASPRLKLLYSFCKK